MADDPAAEPEERVKVVYCGGCNPQIDRADVAAGLPIHDPGVRPGATVYVSGCPRACASDHQLASPGAAPESPHNAERASHPGDDPVTVVVAGELVDGAPTPEVQLAPTITRKLKE